MNDRATDETPERRLANAEAALAEMRERQANLLARESGFRRLFDSLDDGMAVVEMMHDDRGEIVDMVFRDVNVAYERQGGISDVIGRSVIEMLPGVEDIWLERYRRVARTGEPLRIEDYQQDVDRWFDVYFSRVDADGRYVAIVFKDITERKRADAMLRESEARQRLLIGAWAQAVWETDADGAVKKDSPTWRAYTGQTLDEWLGYGWLNAIHPDDRAYAERQWREAVAVCGLVDAEFRLRAPGGEWRWTNVRAAPVLDAEGSVRKWAGMNIDIDARKRADVALRKSGERYRSLFETMDEGYLLGEVLFDGNERAIDIRFVEANPAAIGLAGRDFSGRRMREIDPNYEESWYESYGQVALTGEPLRLQRYAEPHGRWFDVRLSSADHDGSLVACVFQDITEQKQAELARADREKRQAFLLRFSDALRAEESVDEVAVRALRLMSNELELDRSYITVYRPDENRADVLHQIGNDRVPPLPDMFVLSDYPEAFEAVHEQTFVIEDDLERRGLSQAERRNSEALGMRAMVASTLRKGVRHPLWSMVAISAIPRRWTQVEIALIEEVAERTWAAMERARTQATIRESEDRQAFLLALSDAIRPYSSAAYIQGETTRMLRERLDASWCYYVNWDLDRRLGLVLRDSVREGLSSLAGAHDVSAAPEFLQLLADGAVRTVRDYANYEELPARIRQSFVDLGFRSMMMAPLVKEGRLIATLLVGDTQIREWSGGDASLLNEVAERTWAAIERGRSEVALRESEERFQQFASSSSGALWTRNAETLEMEYVSSAIENIYGVAPDTMLGDIRRWAEHIVPEDRETALAHLREVGGGEPIVHEFRILRASDGAFRWIRNTVFPLLDERGQVQRIGGIFEDVTDVKQAAEHRNVLLFELQHRVRNILAMIRSVTQRTSHTAGSVTEYRDLLDGRMRALSHIRVLLTRSVNAGVDLATLIRDEVEAQAEHASQLLLSGPDLVLSPKAAEVVTLAIHELTTNALKYGALAGSVGSLSVTWRVAYEGEEPWLRLDWRETKGGGPLTPPTRRGFGTELIEDRIPYELDGRGTFSFRPDGLACHLTFPLRRGDSILETDAVTLKTRIEGGSLDMAGEADLNGCRVLVIEDDYYLASDTARALRKAGAEVLGPVGEEVQALALITEQHVTCALVDINLGDGLLFGVADALKMRGVSFVFVTGYDDVMIPERFSDVPRMRKPTDFRDVVRAAARMCRAADRPLRRINGSRPQLTSASGRALSRAGCP